MSATADPASVAYSFVTQYYSYLDKNPSMLYSFYKEHSTFSVSRASHGGAPAITKSAVGKDQILNEIMATLRPFNGHPCKANIRCIDSQESRQGGVMVLVTGFLTVSGTPVTQHFTQSFFLDKRTEPLEGYFVLNDILRYAPCTPLLDRSHDMTGRSSSPLQGAMPVPNTEATDNANFAPRMPPTPMGNGDAGINVRPPACAGEVSSPPGPGDSGQDDVDERVAEVAIDFSDEDDEEEEEEELIKPNDEENAVEGEGNFDGGEVVEVEAAGEGERLEDIPAVGSNEDELAEEDEVEEVEEPPTWASLAGRLQKGSGQLGPSKVQGFGYPAGSSRTGIGVGGAAAASKASSTPNAAAGKSGIAWLWVSRLPLDPAADNQEVLDGLNHFLTEWGADGRAVEIERRDPQQEWASIVVTTQTAAHILIALSKDRQLLLRGKALKAEPHRLTYGSKRQGRSAGSASTGGKGVGGSNAPRDDERRDPKVGPAEGRGAGAGGIGAPGAGKGLRRRVRGNGADDGRERFGPMNSPNHSSPVELSSRGFGRLHK